MKANNKRPGDFSLNDFYKHLADFEQTADRNKRAPLTPEQKDMLIKARAAGMPYSQIREYWKKLGWGDFCVTALQNKYRKIANE